MLCTCVPLHHMHAWCPWNPGTGIQTGGCEGPCGHWKWKLDPLGKQSVRLSIEPSPQLLNSFYILDSKPPVR